MYIYGENVRRKRPAKTSNENIRQKRPTKTSGENANVNEPLQQTSKTMTSPNWVQYNLNKKMLNLPNVTKLIRYI